MEKAFLPPLKCLFSLEYIRISVNKKNICEKSNCTYAFPRNFSSEKNAQPQFFSHQPPKNYANKRAKNDI